MNRLIYNNFIPCFQITVGMQTERIDRIWAMTSLGAPNVWCLYRLSTRTNQRAVYFFCQKYYKLRNSGKRRKPVNTNFRLLSFTNEQNWNTAKFGKTLFTDPVNILLNNPQDYTSTTYNFLFSTETLFGRETEKERKYRFDSTRNDTSELVVFLSTCTPLFVASKMVWKDQNTPMTRHAT